MGFAWLGLGGRWNWCITNESNVSVCRCALWLTVLVDALDNDEIKVDFKPLYHCIHIYEALGQKPELQRSYQDDRKV